VYRIVFGERGAVLPGSGSGLGGGAESGIRRVAVAHSSGGGWTAEERWTSIGLKPYFNDFVVHTGHALGSTAASSRASIWGTASARGKVAGPAHDQLVLLADQDLLLVLSGGR
jgi:hypothetical protein